MFQLALSKTSQTMQRQLYEVPVVTYALNTLAHCDVDALKPHFLALLVLAPLLFPWTPIFAYFSQPVS